MECTVYAGVDMTLHDMVGCSIDDFCWHLIITFEARYCVDWEPDYFDDCVISRVCDTIATMHYSNLQLLWGSDIEKAMYERH